MKTQTTVTIKTQKFAALKVFKVQVAGTYGIENFDAVATSKIGVLAFCRQNGITGTILSII
jgi:hypothetical protein